MAQQTSINGDRYSFVNISVTMAGVDQPRGVFKSWNYEAAQEPGIVQGNQVTIVGRTAGYGTGTGDFEMLVSEFDDFAADLSQNGLLPIMGTDFLVVISYSVNEIDVRRDVLRGVRITNIKSNNAQGPGESTKSCTVSIARVTLNGIDAFADPTL